MTQLARRHDLTAVVQFNSELDAGAGTPCRPTAAMSCWSRPCVGQASTSGCSSSSPGPDPQLGAAAGRSARDAAGWIGFARQAVRFSLSSRSSASAIARPRPTRGLAWSWRTTLRLARHARAGRTAHPLTPGSIGASCGGGTGDHRDADGVYLCSAEDERRLLDVSRGPDRSFERGGRQYYAAPGPAAGRSHRVFSASSLTPPISTA
jgi:hypothetical protein